MARRKSRSKSRRVRRGAGLMGMLARHHKGRGRPLNVGVRI